MLKRSVWILGLCAYSLYAGEQPHGEEIVKIDPELSVIKRGDSLPVENFEHATDPYLEGYIQALIDANYYEYQVIVTVKDHRVFLANLPTNELMAKSIISFVADVPGVKSVEVRDLTEKEKISRNKYTEQPTVKGIWFPQSTVLFEPLLGDPREPMYAVNWRFGDRVMGRKAVAVSLGDDFPIFRWRDVFRWHGDLQISVQAGVWAVFNFSHVPDRKRNTCELMNSDWLVGIPLTYAFDKWSFRFRFYHISAHLGDELIVDHPKYLEKRKNPSMEALELIGSYQLSSGLRIYAGPGWVVASDDSFKLKPLYAKWGSEVRLFGKKLYYHKLYGTPFFVVHLENWQQHHWSLEQFYLMGYEFSKLQGVGRKMRLYVEYHQGHSYEGQFFNKKTRYGQVGLSWGF
jgi:hypothetical protein